MFEAGYCLDRIGVKTRVTLGPTVRVVVTVRPYGNTTCTTEINACKNTLLFIKVIPFSSRLKSTYV